ncbi:MAG: PocR ligand-binding domain-containing protein [Atribacterota bacterium]
MMMVNDLIKGKIRGEIKNILTLLLDLFAATTKSVIVLCDSDGKELWCTCEEDFSPLCGYAKENKELWAFCHKDHVDRASINNFNIKLEPMISMCHFGLWNISYPIHYDNIFYGALLTGQKKLSDNACKSKSDIQFKKRVLQLKKENYIDDTVSDRLKACYSKVEYIDNFPNKLLEKLAQCEQKLIEFNQSFFNRIKRITLLRHEVHQPNIIVRETLLEILDDAYNLKKLGKNISPVIIDGLISNIEHTIGNSKLFSAIIENICSALSNEKYLLDKNKVKKCYIIPMLNEAMRVFIPPAGKRDILLNRINKNKLGEDDDYIYGDKSLLMRAFINMYHNSVKYSYAGQSESEPRTINTICESNNEFIRITVSNFGLGILPSELDRVWEDGYRGLLSSDRRRTGSGLGLSQIKQIVIAHSGRVKIESIPQTEDKINGPYVTRITIELPFYPKEEK